ncbi:TetR/AcrR family transcriptional regulator [Nitratireductor aquimarinus]|uniref:TetR/AcrR family transcriptional regulator n=1 Tax=Nitratireductor aquimarinus TaxID=889300 RepID=A0ABU4AL39_9HYPH|nr:TetR/AcrR family transcriptional regulator [Nitratireductor aquimarinus]MDV6226972.1 TetR/AcrR family transcriptional regulator [Nitratireductor aquimarinus]
MRNNEKQAQARSIATREKLITTALDVIYDVGYNKASTPEFSKRAGVSRGALLHHFPTRADIIVAAMDRLLNDGTRDIRDAAVAVAQQKIGLDELMDFLWTMFSGRFFYISIEFINEARTDPDLREQMLPVVKSFHEALDGIWSELHREEDCPPHEAQIVLNLTICLLRGMGIQTVLKDDPEYFSSMLEAWKAILPHLVGGRGRQMMFEPKNPDSG